MSETTTITPEERAEIRAELNDRHLLPYAGLGLRLLNDLEAAEGRKEEAESSLARAYTEIGEMSAGIEKIAAANHALAEKAQQAEAENARLREALESITGIVNAAPELNMSNYDEDQVSALNDDMINVCRILQKEAARRAVAAGEGE